MSCIVFGLLHMQRMLKDLVTSEFILLLLLLLLYYETTTICLCVLRLPARYRQHCRLPTYSIVKIVPLIRICIF